MATNFDEMKAHSLIISKPFAPMLARLSCVCLKCIKTSYETRKPQVVSKSHIPLGYETDTAALILTLIKRLAHTAIAAAHSSYAIAKQNAPQTILASWRGVVAASILCARLRVFHRNLRNHCATTNGAGWTPARKIKGISFEADFSKANMHSFLILCANFLIKQANNK
jgi:hypothetical protein